jgi:hypothetical protein
MNTIVIEHVPIAELPAAWQAKLQAASDTKVTIRIDQEEGTAAQRFHDLSNNPMIGMWSDCEDMRDVAACNTVFIPLTEAISARTMQLIDRYTLSHGL